MSGHLIVEVRLGWNERNKANDVPQAQAAISDEFEMNNE